MFISVKTRLLAHFVAAAHEIWVCDARSACRCLQKGALWLLRASSTAEQHAVLYSLAVAACMLAYTVYLLVPATGPEGAATHAALAGHFSCTARTRWHEVRLMGGISSWQQLRANKPAMLGVRQGTVVLLVPNRPSDLEQLAAVLEDLDPPQMIILCTAANIPKAAQAAGPSRIFCSAFLQVLPCFDKSDSLQTALVLCSLGEACCQNHTRQAESIALHRVLSC